MVSIPVLELLFGFHLIFSSFSWLFYRLFKLEKDFPDYFTLFKEQNTGKGDFKIKI